MVLVGVVAYAFGPMIFRPPTPPLVGQLAPDVVIGIVSPAPGGEAAKTFALRDHRGKVVVMELFATWSDLCDQQQKMVDEVVKEQKPERVQVIGIVTGDDRKNLDAWLEKHHVEFPIAFDEGDRVAHTLDVNNVPAFVIVSPSGRVSSVLPVGLEASELRKLIDRAR